MTMNRRSLLGGMVGLFVVPFATKKQGRVPVIDYEMSHHRGGSKAYDKFGALFRRTLVLEEIPEHFVLEAWMNTDGSLLLDVVDIDVEGVQKPHSQMNCMMKPIVNTYEGFSILRCTIKPTHWAVRAWTGEGKLIGIFNQGDFKA